MAHPFQLHQQLLQVECDLKCAAKWSTRMMIWPFAFSNVAEERGALSVLVVICTKDFTKICGPTIKSLITDTPTDGN
jgi:hypothetical protein